MVALLMALTFHLFSHALGFSQTTWIGDSTMLSLLSPVENRYQCPAVTPGSQSPYCVTGQQLQLSPSGLHSCTALRYWRTIFKTTRMETSHDTSFSQGTIYLLTQNQTTSGLPRILEWRPASWTETVSFPYFVHQVHSAYGVTEADRLYWGTDGGCTRAGT